VTDLPAGVRWAAMAWAFVAGAAVGSFLNVVVARLPAGESVVRPRSRCPACRTPIGWRDNLPVISWLLLGGRCRACRAPISWRYPLVEILGGLAALVAVHRHGLGVAALTEFGLAATLLALSFIDLDTWLLPHALTVPLLLAGVGLSALGLTAAPSLLSSAAGAAVGWLAFAAVSLVGEKVLRKEALGFGDVWLLGGIGAWLGLGALLPVVLLASLQGTAIGLLLIAVGRAQPGPEDEPAGPEDAGPAPPAVEGEPPVLVLPAPGAGPAAGSPAAAEDPDADWVPPRNAVPFGPFLAAGALEWLWLQGWIADLVPGLSVFR
jgi:leader peptidase (prepilin peptidase) / N-methyltransferase